MPWTRPTLAALRTQVRNRIVTEMAAAGYRVESAIPRSLVRILADTFAGSLHVLYGALEWAARQILPDLADTDYLERHGAVYGVTRQEAGAWTGTLTFTGVNTTVVPEGTIATRADGAVYMTTAAGTISGGTVTVAAEAEVAGADGNVDDATELTLGVSIVGVYSTVTVAATTTAGTDEETDAELRERILQRIQETPQGGSADDYERWAREVDGVFRARAVPLARGAGTVDVYFLHDEGTGYGIPTSPQITEVQAYLDDKRPVTADVDAKAPTTSTVAFTIGALEPDTADTRAAIEAELDALFLRKALAVDAAGDPETIYVSDFWQAAASAEGVTGVDIDSPVADLTPTVGQVYIRGTITWPV